VGAVLARDLGDSVPQTHRVIVHREQGGAPPRSILQRSRSSVGAGLTREPGDAVYQAHRVIVHREQARLLQVECDLCGSGACPRLGRLGSSDTPRHRSSRASALLRVYSPVGVVGGYDGDECGVSGKPMFAAFGSSYRLGVRPLGQVGGRHKQKQVGCQAASLWLLIWALG